MAHVKPVVNDRAIQTVKRSVSGALFLISIVGIWMFGALLSIFWIPMLLFACTGFIWYSDQFPGFTCRTGADVSPEAHGCLFALASWGYLILVAYHVSKALVLRMFG